MERHVYWTSWTQQVKKSTGQCPLESRKAQFFNPRESKEKACCQRKSKVTGTFL